MFQPRVVVYPAICQALTTLGFGRLINFNQLGAKERVEGKKKGGVKEINRRI